MTPHEFECEIEKSNNVLESVSLSLMYLVGFLISPITDKLTNHANNYERKRIRECVIDWVEQYGLERPAVHNIGLDTLFLKFYLSGDYTIIYVPCEETWYLTDVWNNVYTQYPLDEGDKRLYCPILARVKGIYQKYKKRY